MQDMYYDAIFSYSDKVPRHVRIAMEEAFILKRRYAMELVTPNFRKWNIEYSRSTRMFSEPEYNLFIRNKENEVLEIFNNMWGGPVELFADEHGDIAGRFILKKFRGDRLIIMHMMLKPRPNEKLYDLLSR